MIGIIGGTYESKTIIEQLNKFTDDIFISVISEEGKKLYSNLKYKFINVKPIDTIQLLDYIKKYNIKIFIDVSHPYAYEITDNLLKVCELKQIKYFRFERKSLLQKFFDYKKILIISNYSELPDILKNIKGTILNTTGSNNIDKIMKLKLKNRIIHRILPNVNSLEKCYANNVESADIIAIRGPFTYNFNKLLFNEFNISTILMKDSGIHGGSLTKFEAAQDLSLNIVVLKKNIFYKKVVVYENEKKLVDEVKKYYERKSWRKY